MKKLFILLFSLIIFIPGLKAEENYYDWELVEVEELPEASEVTMNKVYVFNQHYYVVNEIIGESTPLPLGENLNGKTVYFNFPDNFYEVLSSCSWICNFATGSSSWYIDTRNAIMLQEPAQKNLLGSNYGLYYYLNGSIKRNATEYTFDFDYTINSWANDEYSTYFSLTPLINTYSWQEVNKNQVIEILLDERDFYLFYSFEDIKNFDILSNYDLDSFSDYQKIVVTLGFNSLFLGIIGLSIYIIIKFIYKGVSLLFRF